MTPTVFLPVELFKPRDFTLPSKYSLTVNIVFSSIFLSFEQELKSPFVCPVHLDIGSETPVNIGQLNYGYRLTPKGIILVEATTWTYYEPLGTYGDSEEFYPGKVCAYEVGLGYQQFLWKNLYAAAVATPFLQKFYAEDKTETKNGFQLYLQFIAGSRWEFSKNAGL